jgi:hypothetical protein
MNKKQRLEEMIAYEKKRIEAHQLKDRLHCDLIAKRMQHEFFFRMLCADAGITSPVGMERATIDAYIDQTKRLLERLERVKSTELS